MSEKGEGTTVIAQTSCDDCFRSVQHSGEPKGAFESIGGVETYIALPSTGAVNKGVILYYSDVFGVTYINNKLIMDYFASQGFTVLGIDYFFGDSIGDHLEDPNFDRQTWLEKARARALACAPAWLEAVREKYGLETKYAAVGYCFGAPFVMKIGAEEKVAAGAFCHPSRLSDEDFLEMKAPLLMCCAEIDSAFPLDKRRRAEDILLEGKKEYYIQVFSQVSHGFAVKGNPDIEAQRFAKEESARAIVSWFSRYLK